MQKIKKLTAIILICLCFFSVIFNAIKGSKSAGEIKISFWGTNLPYELALKEIANQYNAMQDDYKVVVSKEDAGNYRTWMGARLASGNASDLLATTSVYANSDAQNGYLYDFTAQLQEENPYSNSGRAWKDDFAATYLQQVAYSADNSRYFCVPTSTVSVRFIINVEMFEKYGIEIPTNDWTFSDFRRICEKFEEQGVMPLQIANSKSITYMVSWLIDIFMAQVKYDQINGYDLNKNTQVETEEIVAAFLSGDNEKLNLSTDSDFRDVLRFIKIWSNYWQDGFNAKEETSEDFLRQRVPIMFCGSWGVSGIELTLDNDNPLADKNNPYKKFEYKGLVVPRLEKEIYISKSESFYFPNLKEGLPLQELGEASDVFCIPKSVEKSGKIEGVIDFLRFYTSPRGASIMSDMAYYISIIKDVSVREQMKDFMAPDNSESVKMRFNCLNLANGIAEEYHFKQMQLYLMNGTGSIGLDTLCSNVQKKYIEVVSQLAEDNDWSFS